MIQIETREVHLYKMVDMCATKDEGESMEESRLRNQKEPNQTTRRADIMITSMTYNDSRDSESISKDQHGSLVLLICG